jgi:hypothetical protein
LWYDVSVRAVHRSVRGLPRHPLFTLDLRRVQKS